jgi:hypothetical protein
VLCRITSFVDSFVGHVDVFYRPSNQPPVVDAGPGTTIEESGTASLEGSVSDDGRPDPPRETTSTWSKSEGPGEAVFADASDPETTATFTAPGLYVLRLTANDGEMQGHDEVQVLVEEDEAEPPPPGPELDAPPLTETAATDLGAATAFLYTGDSPVQTGVEPGAILRERAAVVHGMVFDRDSGDPLPGVTVTVQGHPEWGQTQSREEGRFDFALNGDGYVILVYAKDGYINAYRQVHVQPQMYSQAEDVALVEQDPATTAVDLDDPGMKVARGSVESDADGARQATLLFPEGVSASFRTPGGLVPVSQLTIRLTEFTVGEDGPMAMPAELPPASKYTYALELSADEMEAAGATGIEFSEPLPFYVEDFVGFPVGETAPLGYYDRERGVWVPLPSGIVLQIVSETGGLADIDVDGDGVADDVSLDPGISEAERATLAGLYEPGQVLWRVEVPHFSELDINWAKAALDDLLQQGVKALDNLLSGVLRPGLPRLVHRAGEPGAGRGNRAHRRAFEPALLKLAVDGREPARDHGDGSSAAGELRGRQRLRERRRPGHRTLLRGHPEPELDVRMGWIRWLRQAAGRGLHGRRHLRQLFRGAVRRDFHLRRGGRFERRHSARRAHPEDGPHQQAVRARRLGAVVRAWLAGGRLDAEPAPRVRPGQQNRAAWHG